MQADPPTLSEFERAASELAPHLVATPLVAYAGEAGDAPIWLKPEILQQAGCFKVRGVHHAVASMDPERRARGVSTVSAGNTAKALAWSARHFGVPARALMPDSAPRTKVQAVEAFGGTPVLVPVERVFDFLRNHGWEQEPYAFVHPWTSRDVMIGHGTMGLEIAADLPELATVFIPVGGGGLLGGVGTAIKAVRPDVRIVAVEPAGCPSLHAALEAGQPVDVDCDTICDGVAVPYITAEMFPLLRELVDESVLVSEVDVKRAIQRLVAHNHLVAEGSGALALAAALNTDAHRRGTSVCLVTGGSIDRTKLTSILETDWT